MRGRGAWLAALALTAAALALACGGDVPTPVTPTPTATPTATAMPTPTLTPVSGPACTEETLGVDPAANVGLANDCTTLLAIKATLAGTATLNWSVDTLLTSWDGVTVSGTPERVTGLDLASRGLTGTLPAELGRLTNLRKLHLDRNSLTGWVPSELGRLTGLTSLYLSGNMLRGCVPAALEGVPDTDSAALLIVYCREPVDVSLGPFSLGPGTYQFVLNSRIAPIIFDVPQGGSVEILGFGAGGEDHMLYLQDLTSGEYICLVIFTADECDRWGGPPDSESADSTPSVLDRLSRSARVGERPQDPKAEPTPAPPPVVTPICTQATLGADPTTNAGLARDCDTLLAVKATMAGTGALNWSAGTLLASWDGVTVSGTPERVTSLVLTARGLTGALPAGLWALTQLTELRLDQNQLTGLIPSQWRQLTNLRHAYLEGNPVRGCIPVEWSSVAHNDFGSLGLSYCRVPSVIPWGEDTITGGTHQFPFEDLPLVLDIPIGVTVEIGDIEYDEPADSSVPGVSVVLYVGDSWIAISMLTGEEVHRYVQPDGSPGAGESSSQSVSEILDWIARSARIAEGP